MHLGIDFGTCFTSAAVLTGKQFRFVRDNSGGNAQLTYPSAVCFTPEGELLLGTLAKNSARKYPSRFRDEIKRDLGSDTPYLLGDRQFLPEDLIAKILAHLREEAEKGFSASISEAILTVPASYDAYRRDLMRKAGIAAGFREEGVALLDEPEAAALSYEWQLQQQGSAMPEGTILLVYDLGGGTFDAALMRKEGANFRSLAPPVGEAHCGGIDFDHAIYQEIMAVASPELRDLLVSENVSVHALRMKQQMADYCRDVKHQLTTLQQFEDVLPGPGMEDFVLTRAKFEQKIAPYVDGTIALCKQLVSSSGYSWDKVNGILLVGGSSRIPYVGTRLSEAFHRPLWQVEDPKLAVCMGAAYATVKPQDEPGLEPKGGRTMALIPCPECGRSVSTRAIACPQCGCPLDASPTSEPQDAPEPNREAQVMEEITGLASRLTAPRQTEAQVRAILRTIVEKQRALSSMERYINLAAECGVLVLSNEDVHLLAELQDYQRASIRSLYVPCCPRLDDVLAKEIGTMVKLETVDLSYCPNISYDAFVTWTNSALFSQNTPELLVLRTVYLRSSRLNYSAVSLLGFACRNIKELYLDGSPEINYLIFSLREDLPGLRVLSVVGCPVRHPKVDFAEIFKEDLPNCKLIGP